MDLDELQTGTSNLLPEIDEAPKSRREFYGHVHRKLNEFRARGLPLPEDLLRIERTLEDDFCAESQGR